MYPLSPPLKPVNMYPPSKSGFYDVFGNLWEWMEDNFNGLPSSGSHYLYDDFSTPTYDGRHNVILVSPINSDQTHSGCDFFVFNFCLPQTKEFFFFFFNSCLIFFKDQILHGHRLCKSYDRLYSHEVESLFSGRYYLGLVLLNTAFVKSILGPVLHKIGLKARIRPKSLGSILN